jgi:predicted ABC-type ATPase
VLEPTLTIIAGCNGSGKSTFSKSYFHHITPFDYDKRYLEIYKALPDSEFRDKFAKDKTTEEFINAFKKAISHKNHFCFETNFDAYPIYYAKKAKNAGYNLHLHFYCLENIDIAYERVAIRTANKGHFVPKATVKHKWKAGYNNLNKHFRIFDYILFIDNSKHLEIPENMFTLTKDKKGNFQIETYSEIPKYTENRLPQIHTLLNN